MISTNENIINIIDLITDIFNENNISVDESLIITHMINDIALSNMKAKKYGEDSIFLDPNLINIEQ